jgi:hypothetical protein
VKLSIEYIEYLSETAIFIGMICRNDFMWAFYKTKNGDFAVQGIRSLGCTDNGVLDVLLSNQQYLGEKFPIGDATILKNITLNELKLIVDKNFQHTIWIKNDHQS